MIPLRIWKSASKPGETSESHYNLLIYFRLVRSKGPDCPIWRCLLVKIESVGRPTFSTRSLGSRNLLLVTHLGCVRFKV